MNFSGTKDITEKIIRDTADEMDYLIYESSILVKGEQSQIIVRIDHLKGITVKDCATFTRELTKRLDDQKILPNYTLEISSPGLSRKLRSIDEFIRFADSPAKVVYESEDKMITVKGIINNIIDTKIELKSDNKVIIIDFDTIKKANLEY